MRVGADTYRLIGESKEETDQSQLYWTNFDARETIEALREIGLLDDIISTKEWIGDLSQELLDSQHRPIEISSI